MRPLKTYDSPVKLNNCMKKTAPIQILNLESSFLRLICRINILFNLLVSIFVLDSRQILLLLPAFADQGFK